MNRIDRTFQRLKKDNRKALIPFVVSGDGGEETTSRMVLELEAAGADLVELGMPFSDPIADGPAIQRAAGRALGAGYTTKKLFRILETVRSRTEIPVVLMGYFNPILAYGVEPFCRDAARAGADGLLVVDLPLEQLAALKDPFQTAGLHSILLAAPTSGPDRIERICGKAGGFVYYISLTGVTGTENALNLTEIHGNVRHIKSKTDLPVVVGFGISRPEQVRDAGHAADGVVVGSALVRVMERHLDSPDLFEQARLFIEGLRAGLDSIESGGEGSLPRAAAV
ncbi:MAG: tryptophan synthase subunit alpha [Deltaproteobacteria bacterium]|nr:tryptophan synthase subunit alpha [Deltaproteobacteria bacterium]